MSREIKLLGFDFQNLLAFLAMMGLLKTLTRQKPDWHPRVSWADWKGAMKPHLHIASDASDKEIVDAVVDGLIDIGSMMEFGTYKKLKITLEEFRELQKNTSPEIMASLGSDGITKVDGKEKKVAYPPLCLLLGQGHQFFLERLEAATNVDDKKKVSKEISDVLFDIWKYDDKSEITFRWDPKEYRQHAHMSKSPSDKKFLSVNGANRLAAVGFTNYTCVPTSRGLEALACSRKKVIWPIWNKKLTLPAILVLMRHPHMKKIQETQQTAQKRKVLISDLRYYGVESMIVADIIKEGKYSNVTMGRRII